MKRLLQKEVLRLIGLALLGAILGAFWGQAALGAACVLTLLLAQHVWQLLRMAHWLQNPDDTPPEARRLWGDIFDGIYHYQRAKKRQSSSCHNCLNVFKTPAKRYAMAS